MEKKNVSQVGLAAMMMTEYMLGPKRVLLKDQITLQSLAELTTFIVKDAGRPQVDSEDIKRCRIYSNKWWNKEKVILYIKRNQVTVKYM